MASGEQLPPERDLAAELGVSRMTLRRAIDELVARGAVRRRHGSGVFALGPKLDQALMASSFTEDMRARGLHPGARTLSFDVGPVGARIRSRLKLAEHDDAVQVTRLRLADDEPIALEELHVPRALVPDLAAADLEDPLLLRPAARALRHRRRPQRPGTTTSSSSAIVPGGRAPATAE